MAWFLEYNFQIIIKLNFNGLSISLIYILNFEKIWKIHNKVENFELFKKYIKFWLFQKVGKNS